jgi:multidrug efflux pump subunit AcrB
VYRGPRYATIRLVLDKNETDTKTLRATVEKQIRGIVDQFKPAEIEEIVVIANERGANDRRTNLSTIEIKGKDISQFDPARADIVALIKANQSAVEYVKPEHDGPDTYRFILDNKKLSEYSLSREELSMQVRSLTGTVEIAETRGKNRWMNVYMEPLEYEIPNAKNLAALRIQPFDDGQVVGLAQFGKWESMGYSETIEHKNNTRNLKLDFRYDGKATNEQVIKKELAALLAPISEKYRNLDIRVVDANEQDKKGREWGLKVILLAGISIYLILAITLGSFTQPFIVGLPIPFAVIGVIWALKFHGMQLGLMAMLGLIGTMGVAVNDSIVMVHQINLLWKKFGVKSAELVIDGAASRLRAIVLTASCTLIGVFPTAYGLGGESGFTQPLAFSMGWGLSASLLLTLFIIPAMLMVLKDIGGLVERVFKRRKTPHQEPGDSQRQLDLAN